MVEGKVRVAVIGGGRTGTPLIADFLKRPFVELVGVADVDGDSPGAVLARQSGLFFTTDAMDLAEKGADLDLLIEVSGDPTLKRRLKDAFIAQENRHTIILHDLVARLIVSVVSGSETLVDTYHPGDNGVG